MSEMTALALVLALLGGAVLGVMFFGGLWWTIRLGVRSTAPARWFLGSLVLRMGVAVGGMALFSHRDWRQLIVCLLGFLLARWWVVRSSGMFATAAKPRTTRVPA